MSDDDNEDEEPCAHEEGSCAHNVGPFVLGGKRKRVTCSVEGCLKWVKSNGLCVEHGGGKKCNTYTDGVRCTSSAVGQFLQCVKHGGGNPCEYENNGEKCKSMAFRTMKLCILHGGGYRCKFIDKDGNKCTSAGRTLANPYCTKHGGGLRCHFEVDGKKCGSAAADSNGICLKHGGGQRCNATVDGKPCGSSAAGNTDFCKKHKGGRRCLHKTDGQPCKSAAVSNNLCRAHGGGTRCSFSENGVDCPHSAYAATQRCVKHGGGTRCEFKEDGVDCPSSAAGPTKFCIKHGGGYRCPVMEDGKQCTSGAARKNENCIRHGGGIRCETMIDGKQCSTSAAKGYKHCRTHGGGPRCPNCIDWIDSRSGNKLYDNYCATCFKRIFPTDPRSAAIFTNTKEIRVRNFINKHFQNFVHDQVLWLGGCDCTHKRRVDHRFLLNETIIAVETDEMGHRYYDKTEDEIRYNDLYMVHSGRWIFIRYNCDGGKGMDTEDMLEILRDEIEKQIERVTFGENTELVEIIYLFY